MSAITLTQELTRLRSINPPGDERPCAELLGRLLEAAGLTVSFHSFAEGRTSLIATLEGPDNAPPLCFTGHLDTVPLGTAAWDYDPLGGEMDGDRLYGRGASDMKSGVAAMAVAAIDLARLPRRKSGLVLIFTAGEETGCDGARFLAGLGDVLPKAGALVVGEPTG
ncbi:MAG TPA: M20/M25/M40 family metallo-hydrolase, partial [Verrucomicrobiae bacterium]|nr:M20/M25/M40 family metallo-hydrolase [Verrucomicrobiae bacterium]